MKSRSSVEMLGSGSIKTTPHDCDDPINSDRHFDAPMSLPQTAIIWWRVPTLYLSAAQQFRHKSTYKHTSELPTVYINGRFNRSHVKSRHP